MNFIKRFYNFLKDIPKLFLIWVIFTAIILALAIFVKNKFMSYAQSIQNYAPELQTLQQELYKNVTGVTEVASRVNEITQVINSIINKINLIQYILIPISIFILWCIFQTISYKILQKKTKLKELLFKFIILTLPLYIFLILIGKALVGSYLTWQFILLFLLLFLLFYLTIITYPLISMFNLAESIKKTFDIIYQKFYLILIAIPYALFIVFYFILINLLFIILISNGRGFILIGFLLAVTILILVLLKITFFVIVKDAGDRI